MLSFPASSSFLSSRERIMGQRILIVNESPEIRSFFQTVLEEEGYEVILRSAPFHRAVDIESEHPDLLLLDTFFTRNTSVWQMLDLLLLHPATAALPVVILAQEPGKQKLYAHHPHLHFFGQRFDLEVFLQEIQHTLTICQ